MKFSFNREELLEPLQAVIGAIEKRQTMPILSNILFRAIGGKLQLTATDLEIELQANTEIAVEDAPEVTVPARKLLDISKNLPEGAAVKFSFSKDRVTLSSGRSRFVLATLPANDFPALEDIEFESRFEVSAAQLKGLIDKTGFAMAQQDVRYYLNGLLFECKGNTLRTVATDGHRLALSNIEIEQAIPEGKQVIVPRKGTLELQRLLVEGDELAKIAFSANHIRVSLGNLRFTSKLIDGRFPDYERVMPADGDKVLLAERISLKQSLTRTSILSNEKFRGVRLVALDNQLKIQTQNPDKEEAEEELEVNYQGDLIEVAFNVNYILDVLNVIGNEQVHITLKDPNSSCLIRESEDGASSYVIMPMRL